MAEILISLTIIGVIAAITLPALQANINESAWRAQRKALYSRMSQAISMMPSLNGYGIGATDEETAQDAAHVFITDGLSKVLKIKNICGSTKLADCGMPSQMINIGGSKIQLPQNIAQWNEGYTASQSGELDMITNPHKNMITLSVAFETQNNESVLVLYNPYCYNKDVIMPSINVYSSAGNVVEWNTFPYMCANFIYDLNGKKGPNRVGKDIGFMTALYSVDSNIVAPMPHNKDTGRHNVYPGQAVSLCRAEGSDVRAPNFEELASMVYNINLIAGSNYSPAPRYISSTSSSPGRATSISLNSGVALDTPEGYNSRLRCIKR